MDFDEERIYFSHQNLQQQRDGKLDSVDDNADDLQFDGENGEVDPRTIRRHLKEFLREFVFNLFCINMNL